MINWRVRFKNPVFIFQLILALLLPILAYMGLTFQDISTWPKLGVILLNAIKNPYVFGLIVVSLWNAINDPTTKGISDSEKAKGYNDPK
jgi:phi LC3 family holin